MRRAIFGAGFAILVIGVGLQICKSGPVEAIAPAWAQSESPSISQVLHLAGEVQAKNDDWVRTGVHLEKGDAVSIIAGGNVQLGEYSGKTDPNGDTAGAGRLEAKIGAEDAFGVGAHFAFIDSVSGILKLRVRDSKYSDNSGSYHVDVLVVRSGALPSAMAFRDED